MALIQYKEWNPRGETRTTLDRANSIIHELSAQGYVLTLRQLYYQFVGRGWSENTEQAYKRLGRIVTDAREGGLMDWNAIDDKGRNCYFNSYEDDALKVLEGLEKALGRDPWQDQEIYLEVWVEKQALEGVIARPCRKRRTPYMACKGYLSASEAWRAGQRFERAIARGKRPVMIHLGDHDPSGMDMTRDNAVRLELFSRQGVNVRRVALNMDQIEQYSPPPAPSKEQDSREKGYALKHNTKSSWELDALQPSVIDGLITGAIEACIDQDQWVKSLEAERVLRVESGLAFLADRYDEVRQLVLMQEKPLDRLARLDGIISEVPELMTRLGERLHAAPMQASKSTLTVAEESLKNVTPYGVETEPKDEQPNEVVLVTNLMAQVTRTVSGVPLSGTTERDSSLAHQGYSLARAVEEANTPTPYVLPDVMIDNDFDPKDPDEEDQEAYD